MKWFIKYWKKLAKALQRDSDKPDIFVPHWSPVSAKSDGLLINFRPHALQAIGLAKDEARRLNHNFVGTEHLLLGLIGLQEQGIAVVGLGNIGFNLETVRAEVEKQDGKGPDEKTGRPMPFTPRVHKVFALAREQAKSLNQTNIGTEHILLGILCEGHGVAARVLKTLDVNLKMMVEAILKELDPTYQSPTGADKPV